MTNSSANLTTVSSSASLSNIGKSNGTLTTSPSLGGEMEKVINRKISSTSLYEQSNVFSQDSILPNMSRFINSINNMNHVVMVPSKLYDCEADEPIDPNCDNKSVHSLGSEESSLSHSSSVGSNLVTFEVPSSDAGNTTSDSIANESVSMPTMYDQYRMLIQAKEELMWGTSVHRNEPVETQLSAQFRHTVNQLNSLLSQFSDMADFLTSKYQDMYEN